MRSDKRDATLDSFAGGIMHEAGIARKDKPKAEDPRIVGPYDKHFSAYQ